MADETKYTSAYTGAEIDEALENAMDAATKSLLSDEWATGTSYTAGTIVIHNNSLWVCTTDTSSEEPTSAASCWVQSTVNDAIYRNTLKTRSGSANIDNSGVTSVTYDPFPHSVLFAFAWNAQVNSSSTFGAPQAITCANRSNGTLQIGQMNSASASCEVQWVAFGY